jgi:hypothetical protein
MTNEELTTKIAALEKELAALKSQVKPTTKLPPKGSWPKYDPTEGFRMPASAVKPMAAIVPDMPKAAGFDAHAHSQTKGPGSPGGFGPSPGGWPKDGDRGKGRDDELEIPPQPWSGWQK